MWNTFTIITRFTGNLYYVFNCFCQSKMSTGAHTWSWILYWSWRWQYKESPGNLWLAWMLGACLFWLAMCPGEPLVNSLWTVTIFVSNSLKNLGPAFWNDSEPCTGVQRSSPSGFNWNDQTHPKQEKFCFSAGKQRRKVTHVENTWRNFIWTEPSKTRVEVDKHSFWKYIDDWASISSFANNWATEPPPTVFS